MSYFNTSSLHTFSFSWTLSSLLKHYLDLYITDTALKVSQSLYSFTTSISHGVEKYFPRLWGTGISDAIFLFNKHCTYYSDLPSSHMCLGVCVRSIYKLFCFLYSVI